MSAATEQEVWFSEQLMKAAESLIENPCVRAFGAGPEGKTCASCEHLFGNQKSRCYWKCDLRAFSNGPKTDHRRRWPACARYEERKSP